MHSPQHPDKFLIVSEFNWAVPDGERYIYVYIDMCTLTYRCTSTFTYVATCTHLHLCVHACVYKYINTVQLVMQLPLGLGSYDSPPRPSPKPMPASAPTSASAAGELVRVPVQGSLKGDM